MRLRVEISPILILHTDPRARCAKIGLRIETSGDYAWRLDLYDEMGEQLGESTRSGTIDASAEFIRQLLPALQEAVEHPDMTEEHSPKYFRPM